MKKILVLIFVIFLNILNARAYDLILPKNKQEVVKSNYIFFVGKAKKNEIIKINDRSVYIASNGAFAHSVKLKDGENRVLVKSNYQSKLYKFYKVKRNVGIINQFKELSPQLYVVKKDNSPLRSTPINQGLNRISHLFAGTNIIVDGEKDNFYRVILSADKHAWIDKTMVTISEYDIISPKFIDTSCKTYKNGQSHIIKFNENLPYTISETDTEILFKVYNPFVNGRDVYTINIAKSQKYTYKILLKNGEYNIKINYLVPNFETPLKDLVFLIDAGHGGYENGAIGCLGDKEKNINLEIASQLKKLLIEKGAYVVMTRECDAFVSLEDRIKLAQEYAANFFISIHLNSIGDIDFDLHKNRGTSVYYYNQNSKGLATYIEKALSDKIKTRKDGIRQASFAVIRPTEYVGILVEAAYMTNPLDSVIYTSQDFVLDAAQGICDGILNYLSE